MLFSIIAQRDVINIMNELIWQTASGGLLYAVNQLKLRCGLTDSDSLPVSAAAQICLKAAADLVSGGKKPGKGKQALACIFSHLDGKPLSRSLSNPWAAMEGHWQAACPDGDFGSCLDDTRYKNVVRSLCESFDSALEKKDFAAADRICGNILPFLPLMPGDTEDGDISLYDFGRLTAAVASCFAQASIASGLPGCPNAGEECLLLFTCDFSGIQKFIYLISTKSALKMLRSRSFFLEMMMEHLIDELLELCGLARCNCLYAGGGHAYLLLPNTPEIVRAVHNYSDRVNSWLCRQLGVSLYLACGMQPCSPAALFGLAGEEAYSNIFQGLFRKMEHIKFTRYDDQALKMLNLPKTADEAGRECRICGSITGNGDLCSWCDIFTRLGGLLTKPHLAFAVTDHPIDISYLNIPMPGADGSRFISLLSEPQAVSLAGKSDIIRWYSKNEIFPLENCREIWMGDHCPTALLEELNGQTEGIKRMGVFRADVDNLGKAFVSGFHSPEKGKNYLSMSRTMAFSRCMSVFFKSYINEILAPFTGVLVVYSGGDDLFLLGGWNQLLEAAVALQKAFEQYTGAALTFSGGFGLYTTAYPVARAAEETAELEDFSKNLPGKNAITLFAPDESLCFSWPVFAQKVWQEKYKLLDDFFSSDENGRGNAFLYQLLEFLRGADDRLNLARCAYLLARLRPGKKDGAAKINAYEAFSKQFYGWALQPEERRQLIAAIYLYVYLHRKENQDSGRN